MLLKQVMELFDILDSPNVCGDHVLKLFEKYEDITISIDTVVGEKGKTDFIKVLIPGKKGKSIGGNKPTLGILGTLGGLGARPGITGFVSDGDGALAALSAALKLADMHSKGDYLDCDVIVSTHICPDAPIIEKLPVYFMDSPVSDSIINQYTVYSDMDVILSIDTTKGNMVINYKGFAISNTVKNGYILNVSDDLLEIMKRVTGKMPVVFPLATQDITPYGNGLSHLNSILQPAVVTEAPVVGVAITTETAAAGCATGASHFSDIEQTARFCVEVAKDFGKGMCSFYNTDEYEHMVNLYGDMKRLKTFGKGEIDRIKVGIVRIAHSGAEGVKEEIEKLLGPNFEVIEKGALDPYDYKDIVDKFKPVDGGEILTSNLRTGETVIMNSEKVFQEIKRRISEFEAEGVEKILLFCTGFFTGISYKGILIEPGKLVKSVISGLNIKNIGVIVPEPEQAIETMRDYKEFNPTIVAASPYKDINLLKSAAKDLGNSKDISVIVMDCMGFTMEMRDMVRTISKKPVILPRMLGANILKVMFDEEENYVKA